MVFLKSQIFQPYQSAENLIAKGAILVGKGEMHQLGISLFGINYRTVVRNARVESWLIQIWGIMVFFWATNS